MREGARFAAVDLRGAHIAGQLDLSQTTVTGSLSMDSLHVGSNLYMREGDFAEAPRINVIFATIRATLDLSGAFLSSFNLTGTTIGGELRLTQGSFVPTWQPGAQLTLRNTRVGALQEAHEWNSTESASSALAAWPETLDLHGFTYDRLGGLTRENAPDIAARDVTWWDAWLRKQKEYAPQPYTQLAKVLREAGRKDAAREILYTGKERERQATCRRIYPGNLQSCELLYLPWLWLSIQKVFIGYRYRLQYALYWTAGFIVTGVIVLHVFGQEDTYGLRYYGLFYSIDMFLPMISPLKRHYDISLKSGVEAYLYLHRFFGFFLASVLIASLPEVLQKW